MKILLSLLLCVSAFALPVVKHGKGLKREPAKYQLFLKGVTHRPPTRGAVQLPISGDLSPKASLPRDQGNCGSCWAYGLTKALQSELMINGDGGPSSLLDTAYLINNCGGVVDEYGCGGGDMPAGQNFLNGKETTAQFLDSSRISPRHS